jgi:hypothetical protein
MWPSKANFHVYRDISEVKRNPIAHSTHIGQTITYDKSLKHEVYISLSLVYFIARRIGRMEEKEQLIDWLQEGSMKAE